MKMWLIAALVTGLVDLTWTDIVARLEKGAAASDANVLRTAVADAEKLADVTAQDRERELALLGAAYGAWRLSTVPGIQPAEATTLLKSADKNLRGALKINSKSGEASALLASVVGQEIRYGGNKMVLGPEAQSLREDALKAEPNNPRVVLQAAITTYHTPAEYGGGADKAAEAGFPIAGGHTIIDDVPKYGLAVTGVVHVDRLVRNSTAKAGDALMLTKPIGTGILICAYRAASMKRFGRRDAPPIDEAVRWMTMLNRDAAAAMVEVGVDAATDVTGYGLVGHLLEMCGGSGVGAEVRASAVPLLDGAREYLERGFCPEGTKRNLRSFRPRVESHVPEADLTLLCDAQTSGGLLMSVPPEKLGILEQRFRDELRVLIATRPLA